MIIILRERKKEKRENSLKSFTALGVLSLYTAREKLFFFSECVFPPFSVKRIVLPVINVLLTA